MSDSKKNTDLLKSMARPTAVAAAFGALALAMSGPASAHSVYLNSTVSVSDTAGDTKGGPADMAPMVTPAALAIAAAAAAVLIAHTIQSANPPIDGANGANHNLIDHTDRRGAIGHEPTDFDY